MKKVIDSLLGTSLFLFFMCNVSVLFGFILDFAHLGFVWFLGIFLLNVGILYIGVDN